MTTLYVGGLPSSIDAESLRGLFIGYTSVESVRVVESDCGGPHRGFGYVTFADPAEAETAAANLDGAALDTSRLRVAPAQ
ncbi:MAG: RNA-binding protein [Nannocystaceae bacterium]|nr:RNA-binding protein [Nannocystaceae bacterium]